MENLRKIMFICVETEENHREEIERERDRKRVIKTIPTVYLITEIKFVQPKNYFCCQ